jgi:hypothetical protein
LLYVKKAVTLSLDRYVQRVHAWYSNAWIRLPVAVLEEISASGDEVLQMEDRTMFDITWD